MAIAGQILLWAVSGFLVIATLCREMGKSLNITAVESDQRKSVFLREMARKLDIDVNVSTARAESLSGLQADLVSARAFAGLPTILSIAEPILANEHMILAPKGGGWKEEVDAARANWSFDLKTHRSVTAQASRILVIQNLRKN